MTDAQRGERCGKGFIQPEKECRVGGTKSPAPKSGGDKPTPKPASPSNPSENFTYPLKISDRAKKEGYKAILSEVEDQIRGLPHEVAVAVNQRTGEILFATKGDEGAAPISLAQAKRILSSADEITITHNHPLPRSFSGGDMSIAFSLGVEVRAATTDFDHSFIPPKEFKNNPDPEEAKAIGEGARREYERIRQEKIPVFKRRVQGREFSSVDAAQKELTHSVVQEMAQMTGSTYTRTPVKTQKQDSQDTGVDRQISAVIKSVVGKPINLKGYALTQKGEVFGVFSAANQPYRFLANPKTGTFSYVELSEKELKAIGESARQDAKDCDTGKPCGATCIAKGKACNTKLQPKAKALLKVSAPRVPISGGGILGKVALTAIAVLAGLALLDSALSGLIEPISDEPPGDYKLEISEKAKKGGARAVLSEVEDQIRGLPHEVGVAIDEDTGDILFSRGGDYHGVSFTDDDINKMIKGKNVIFTHNHPELQGDKTGITKLDGGPFSPDDFATFVSTNLKEMRAVSPGVTYRLARKIEEKDRLEEHSQEKAEKILSQFSQVQKQLMPAARRRVLLGASQLEASWEMYRGVNTILAQENGYQFSRTEHSPRKDAKDPTVRGYDLDASGNLVLPVKTQKQDSQDTGVDRQISAVIKSVVGKPINLKGYALTQKGEVFGVFSAANQPYRFLANPKTGTFSYVELSEKELKAIGESARQDAKDCDTGKPCGATCIAKGKACNTKLQPKAKALLKVSAPGIQSKGGKNVDVISILAVAVGIAVASSLAKGGGSKYSLGAKSVSASTGEDYELKISDLAKGKGSRAVLEEVEDQIRGLPHEVAVAIDEDTGDVLYSIKGDSSHVPLTLDHAKQMDGKTVIFTHNHPDQKDPSGVSKVDGGPFSRSDVELFYKLAPKEMRAVSPGATYVMRRQDKDHESYKKQPLEDRLDQGSLIGALYEEESSKLIPKHQKKFVSGKYKSPTEAVWGLHGEVNESLSKKLGYTYQRITHSPRKDAKDPTVRQAIASNSRLSSVTRQIQAIAKSVYQKPMQIHGYDLDASGKLVGVFSGGGEMYSFSADPKTGSFEYVEANIPKRRADAYMMGWTIDGGFLRYQREDAKCTIGKSCGGTCIERGRKCRIQLSTAARTQLKATTASLQELKSGGAKFPGGAIMKAAIVGAVGIGAGVAIAAQKKGIAPSQALPSSVLNPTPIPTSTMSGIQDAEGRKQLKKFSPELRKAIIAGAITVGVPVGTYIIAREKYRAGFEESARMATEKGEKFYKTKWFREPVLYNESDADFEDSLPRRNIQERGLTPAKQITFIVGGNDGGDNDLSGEDEAFRGTDGLFDDHRTVAHTTKEAYDERSSVMDRGLLGKFRHDYMNGRNDSAVSLSVQVYAFHKHSPHLPINLVGISGGGLVTHEAAEICKRMGIEVRVVNLGSPWLGMTQKVGPSITLDSINDEVTHNPRLPIRDLVNVNSVTHHDGYWESEQARKVIADFMNGKPIAGSEKAGDLERKKAERRRRLTKRIKDRNRRNRQQQRQV